MAENNCKACVCNVDFLDIYNERDPSGFYVLTEQNSVVDHNSIEITVGLWNTFHGTWALDEGGLC